MPSDTTRDRRARQTFWLDDRVIDEFAPVMGRYTFGMAALAVYTALARRAGCDGESWPRLRTIAQQVGSSERTVQRAIQLLELLGLLEVTSCYEEGSKRQTSNLYTLLTPPAVPPELDPDPAHWPTPCRRTLVVRAGHRAQTVADARQGTPQAASAGQETPRPQDTPPPTSQSPRPRQQGAPSPVSRTPQEGLPSTKDNTLKDRSLTRDDSSRSFTIAEIGLSNRQVWAATLTELARRGAVSASDVDTWLRPAALIGREGEALVLGAPNTAARDRITARLLSAVRAALAQVLGVALPVRVVVVAGSQAGAGGRPGGHAAGPEAGRTAPEQRAAASWR